MKNLMNSALLLSVILLAPETARSSNPHADPEIGIGVFYRPLSGYGEWISIEPGVTVWRPLRVRAGWRPYTEGRWVWTDFGWYWVSAEPFGWAVFHYGRWHYDDYYGWVWLPDHVWGPAWVEWRYDDSYIGWAPLPPYASFHLTFGVRFTRAWTAPVHYWCFIPYHRFGSVVRYREYASEDHARRLMGSTRSGSTYEVDRNRVINRGVDRSTIETRGGSRFERSDIRETGSRREERFLSGSGRTSVVETYRPSAGEFDRRDPTTGVRRGNRRLDLEMDKVERPEVIRPPAERGTPEVTRTPSPRPSLPEIQQPTKRQRTPAAQPAPDRSRQREIRPTPTPPTNREKARVPPSPSRSRSSSPTQQSERTRRRE